MHLPDNTLLRGGALRIVRFISKGGFGCTYEALHIGLNKRVAIKEFFVSDFCNRDEATNMVTTASTSKVELVDKLRKKFIKEARDISSMRHHGVVQVTDIFEENGTAYYVMDYVDGLSLDALVKRDGPLPYGRAVNYMRQVCDALGYVHSRRLLHLDIKPGNIMVDSQDRAILIDFGAAKQYDSVGDENTSTIQGMTIGYAPPEQMGSNTSVFCPATDIYALGATMYKLLTGQTPPSAAVLAAGYELPSLPSSLPEGLRVAIIGSMQSAITARPQSTDEFMHLLDAAPQEADESTRIAVGQPTHDADVTRVNTGQGSQYPQYQVTYQQSQPRPSAPQYQAPQQTPQFVPSRSSNKATPWIVGAVVFLLTLGGGWLIFGKHDNGTAQFGDVDDTENAKEDVAEEAAPAGPSGWTTGYTQGHEWIDLGLSVKWATMNVGASDISETGRFYSYYDFLDVVGIELWDGWNFPTKGNIQELVNNCDYQWTRRNGMAGALFTSRINGGELFIPAGGCIRYNESTGNWREDSYGTGGGFWSSTWDPDGGKFFGLTIDSGNYRFHWLGSAIGVPARLVCR